MKILDIVKNSISSIYAKYIGENEEIEYLPIFYIAGSQTLPPPLSPEEEAKLIEKLSEEDNLEARQNNIDFITKPDNIVKSLLKGKLISSYFSYGADIYDSIIHYKVPYKVRLVDDIIPIRHENYWGDVWYTYKEKYHTETWVSHRTKIKPIKYDYYYSLSVYDLSNKYSFFKNEKRDYQDSL